MFEIKGRPLSRAAAMVTDSFNQSYHLWVDGDNVVWLRPLSVCVVIQDKISTYIYMKGIVHKGTYHVDHQW